MPNATQTEAGAVISLWRYPVKSMIGEGLDAAQLRDQGLLGDRAYALLDRSDGKIATAKNPRKWPNLFAFRATFIAPSADAAQAPSVRITLPDGTIVTSDQSDLNQTLSKVFNRNVTLVATEHGQVTGVHPLMPDSWSAKSEGYWPDIQGLAHRDTVTDFALPTGTFFDCATVHLLTTATLKRLQNSYPQGRFEVGRFRPNIVVEVVGDEQDFPEDAWIGHTLAIGDEVSLKITGPCGRCVMTTLAQGDLPQDIGILRTIAQQNHANAGVYAAVLTRGTIRRGDRVTLIS